MNAQDDLEFMDDDALAGFRLSRIELLNWGTFHEKVWTLSAGGKNLLVTGDIGSGKSTLVDAITTLLVPSQRIAYNKAAGAETRERTLRSYVMGHYKVERSETGYGARPVSLREKNTYSVILGVFENKGYQTVTLAQVFWQRDPLGQPDRFYVVADAELSITGHFANFGTEIRELKKRLKGLDSLDDVYEAFPPYAASFKRRFGIGNDQALELFLQTVSMKTVGNLTDFVRTHMLVASEIEPKIGDLITHFDDLNRAHAAVVKAKEQAGRLRPLAADLDRYAEVSGKSDELIRCRDGLRPYFAGLKADLLEKRIAILDGERRKAEEKIRRLGERLSDQQSERDRLRQAIAENGGDRLERLKSEIRELEAKKQARLRRDGEYRALAGQAGIPFDGSMEAFLGNRASLAGLIDSLNGEETETRNGLVESEMEFRRLRAAHTEVAAELDSLRKRKSNIDAAQVRIRESLCAGTGIPEADIPFAGELLRVRSGESSWEGAAERLLRNFGLSLLVPDRHYAKVSEWVDRNDCRGRIVYFKISAKQESAVLEPGPDSLVHKVEVRPDTEFSDWVSSELARRFDYACCADLARFRRERQAVTASGQVKGAGNRHEKDDRHGIGDRSRYILGWSNEAKIAAFEARRLGLEKEIAETGRTIAALQTGLNAVTERRTLLVRLDGFASWDDLDWQPLSLRISELDQERKELEAASNLLATLNSQLLKLEAGIRETQELLDGEKDIRSRNDEKRAMASASLEENRGIAAEGEQALAGIREKLDLYLEETPGIRHLTVESADNRQSEIRNRLQAEVDSAQKSIKGLVEKIVRNMQDYRREYAAETTDVDARLESGPEFRRMLARLEQDDLPRFESRFKELLNENTIREIANFQSHLNRQRQDIKERIEKINASLAQIEYNKSRYISLEAQESPDAEIREFRQSLKACTEGTITGSGDEQYAEAKFLQVHAIIERFRGRSQSSDADLRWTRKVTDVRNWHVFAASERWFEDGSEYEHYTDSGGKSGGQKEKLAYTVLAASLAYQFGLSWGEVKSRSFRFVAIDEAFGRGSDESARFGLELFRRLNMQLLIVTPLQKIHIIEPFVSGVGFVDCPEGRESRLRNLTIEEYKTEKEALPG